MTTTLLTKEQFASKLKATPNMLAGREFGIMKFGRAAARGLVGKDAIAAHLKSTGMPVGMVSNTIDALPADATAPAKKVFPFILSTPIVDRDGDKINVKGIRRDNYSNNPVMTWAHEYDSLPVGKALTTYMQDDSLKALDVFCSESYDFAKTVEDLYDGGYLNAVSIGFLPIVAEFATDRNEGAINFDEVDMIEHAACPIPVNPQALAVARSMGMNIEPLLLWAEEMLDSTPNSNEHGGLYIPKKALMDLRGKKISVDFGDRKALKIEEAPMNPTEAQIALANAVKLVTEAGMAVVSVKSVAKADVESTEKKPDAEDAADEAGKKKGAANPDNAVNQGKEPVPNPAVEGKPGAKDINPDNAVNQGHEPEPKSVDATKPTMCACPSCGYKDEMTAFANCEKSIAKAEDFAPENATWKALSSTMAKLLGANVTEASKKSVYTVLSKKYREAFGASAPECKSYSVDELKVIAESSQPPMFSKDEMQAFKDSLRKSVQTGLSEPISSLRAEITGRVD